MMTTDNDDMLQTIPRSSMMLKKKRDSAQPALCNDL